jgi:hypothetical protein
MLLKRREMLFSRNWPRRKHREELRLNTLKILEMTSKSKRWRKKLVHKKNSTRKRGFVKKQSCR